MDELSCNWLGTNGSKVKIENECFIVVCSSWRQNLKFVVLWSMAKKYTEV